MYKSAPSFVGGTDMSMKRGAPHPAVVSSKKFKRASSGTAISPVASSAQFGKVNFIHLLLVLTGSLVYVCPIQSFHLFFVKYFLI